MFNQQPQPNKSQHLRILTFSTDYANYKRPNKLTFYGRSQQHMNNKTIKNLFSILTFCLAASNCKNASELQLANGNDLLAAERQPEKIEEIAIIGDSQSTGVYGNRLAELIRSQSRSKLVYFGAASSARIDSWVNGNFSPIPSGAYFGCESVTGKQGCTPTVQPTKRTSSISKLIATYPSIDLYIITLGDNHFFDPSSVISSLPKLIRPILNSGAACVLVTPTVGSGQFANKSKLINNLKSANDMIKNAMGRSCAVIDSYSIGKEILNNQADLELMQSAVSADPMKLHPRGSGAKLWADRVFQSVKNRGLVLSK